MRIVKSAFDAAGAGAAPFSAMPAAIIKKSRRFIRHSSADVALIPPDVSFV
jgi:hypothetical protein